jgi:hypothetical protein
MNNGFYEFSRGKQETATTSSVFPYTGSAIISGSLTVTGSLLVSGSITGSLFGTSSFAVSSSRSVSSSFATTSSFAVSASWAPTQTINTSSFATTGSNTFTGSQTITGSNGRLIYTGTTPGIYPTLAEVHINNDYPWLHRFYNDTFSTSSAVMAYFGWNDGRFVFHNESTQSIGLQVNGYSAENGLLVYSDKVAFVNNVEVTGSLLVSGSITGSLFGTASWATNAITASYASNGGVTQLLAGPNVTLSPTNGLGQVTISSTSGGGGFNTATGSYGSFYDTTIQTNVAGTARSMSLNTTDITNGVSVSGSTNPFNTYIKTENAGVYNIQFSAQVDKTDSGTDEIWIWLRKNGTNLADTATSVQLTGNGAHYVAAWNFFVNAAANDYFQLMWYSPDANVRLHAEPAFGVVPGIPSLIVTVNRVDQFLSNTGSFSGSFTGAFSGSGANLNSIPASAITGLNLSQIATGSVTASVSPTQFTVTSGSVTEFQVTGTGVTLGSALTDTHRVTGSLNVTGSITATTYNNLPTASASSSGIISSSDWNSFNNIVLVSDGIPGTAITGGVSLTRSLVKSYSIPANTFGSGDTLEVWIIGSKVNTNSSWYTSISVNTSNTIASAVEISRANGASTITYLPQQRVFNFTSSTNLRGQVANSNSVGESSFVGTSVTNTTFNTAVDNWILISVYPLTGGTADIMNIEKVIIRRNRYRITP